MDLQKRRQTLRTFLPNREHQNLLVIQLWNRSLIDFAKGEITVPSTAINEVVETIGLAFAIATLVMLVQPAIDLRLSQALITQW